MENEKEMCRKCKYFDRYYTKETKRYNKTKYGLCCKTRDNVGVEGHCDRFEVKPKRGKAKYMVRYFLNDLLTEITEIRKIIEDDENDDTQV